MFTFDKSVENEFCTATSESLCKCIVRADDSACMFVCAFFAHLPNKRVFNLNYFNSIRKEST